MRGIAVRADVIRDLRKAAGLTQEQLAAAADCDVKTVRKAERGTERVDLWVVSAIAEALGSEAGSLIVAGENSELKARLHLSIVKQWVAAFEDADVDRLLALHTEDTVLEIPGSDGLPAAGNFTGIGELRGHFQSFFTLFRLRAVQDDDFHVHAVDDLVFMRSTATIEFLPARKSYTTRHVNEIEFRDGKVARRVTVADYDGLRKIVGL